MRMLCLLLVAAVSCWGPRVAAQSAIAIEASSSDTYLCPQCGKLHVRRTSSGEAVPASPSKAAVPSFENPISSPLLPSSGSVSNVLDALNAQRSRQGLAGLRYDSQLQAVAERRVQQMAASGQKGHPPGSFSPGTYEGVGWSSSYSPSGVSACYTSDPRMRYAGAAMASGRDGVYFAVVYR